MSGPTLVLKVEPPCGSHVVDVAKDACALARRMADYGVACVALEFNGCYWVAAPHTNPSDLVQEFDRRMGGRAGDISSVAVEP